MIFEHKSVIHLRKKGEQLTSLDVSDSPDLGTLNCRSNLLTSLDITNCPKLSDMNCRNNQLTTLDISGSPELGTYFYYDDTVELIKSAE